MLKALQLGMRQFFHIYILRHFIIEDQRFVLVLGLLQGDDLYSLISEIVLHSLFSGKVLFGMMFIFAQRRYQISYIIQENYF